MSQSRRRGQKSLSQPSTSRANNSHDDDDLASLTQAQDKSMSDEEHAQNVANAVKYILGADHVKTPILRTNISKAINFQGGNFRSVLKSARKILHDVFGYDLIDVDTDKKNSGKLILCNSLQNTHLHYDVPTRERYTLLFLVLSHIFMNGEMCTQASLEGFLRQLGIITEDSVRSDIYGDVMDLILVDFVKEKYIASRKSENENEIELTWGERALHEVPVRSVMDFVSQVYEKEPENWTAQYERMLQVEQNQTLAGAGTQNHVQNGMAE